MPPAKPKNVDKVDFGKPKPKTDAGTYKPAPPPKPVPPPAKPTPKITTKEITPKPSKAELERIELEKQREDALNALPGLVKAANAAALNLHLALEKYQNACDLFEVEFVKYDTQTQGLFGKTLMAAYAGGSTGATIGTKVAKYMPEFAGIVIPGAALVGAYLGARAALDIDTSGLDAAAEIVKREEKQVQTALAKMEQPDGELRVCIAVASKQRLDPGAINIIYPTSVATLRKECKI